MTPSNRQMALLILGVFALVGLVGTIFLLATDVDAEGVALVSGLAGTSIGAVAGAITLQPSN